jgi:hypothetical protein
LLFNINIPEPKINTLQIGPKNKMASLSETATTIFIMFQEHKKTICLNKTAQVISSG